MHAGDAHRCGYTWGRCSQVWIYTGDAHRCGCTQGGCSHPRTPSHSPTGARSLRCAPPSPPPTPPRPAPPRRPPGAPRARRRAAGGPGGRRKRKRPRCSLPARRRASPQLGRGGSRARARGAPHRSAPHRLPAAPEMKRVCTLPLWLWLGIVSEAGEQRSGSREGSVLRPGDAGCPPDTCGGAGDAGMGLPRRDGHRESPPSGCLPEPAGSGAALLGIPEPRRVPPRWPPAPTGRARCPPGGPDVGDGGTPPPPRTSRGKEPRGALRAGISPRGEALGGRLPARFISVSYSEASLGSAGQRAGEEGTGRRWSVRALRSPRCPPPAACWWLCSPWEAPQGRWLVKYFPQRWGKRLVGSELNPRGCVRSGGCCTAAQRGLRSPFGERGPWGRAEPGGLAWVKNLQEEKVSSAGRTWKNRFGEYKWNFLSPQLSDSLSPVAFAAVVETSSRAGCRSGRSGTERWYGKKLGL